MTDVSTKIILYASFDEVPGPKGAGRHIEAFVRALGAEFGNLLLVTPGPEDRGPTDFAPGVRQLVLGCPDANPIGRARTFRAKLAQQLASTAFDVIHFRSIFEGLVLIDPSVRKSARVIYEVNGFPSIEMKYHYRSLIDDSYLTDKLVAQEAECLRAADAIITVSQVNRQAIIERQVATAPITVIPNGVDLGAFPFQAPATTGQSIGGDELRIGYVGTFTAWQGVDVAIEALALVLRDRLAERPARLLLLGAASKSRLQSLRRLAERLGVTARVDFQEPGDTAKVRALLQQVHLTVVPLLAVDRNTRQGCCPLKFLEAMAAGCPIVASDLPVIRELATPLQHYIPTRAGDAHNLKNAILQIATDPTLADRLANAARIHVTQNFTWEHATQRLVEVYQRLLA